MTKDVGFNQISVLTGTAIIYLYFSLMQLESKGESQVVGITQKGVAGITVCHLVTTAQLGKIHTVSLWAKEKCLGREELST